MATKKTGGNGRRQDLGQMAERAGKARRVLVRMKPFAPKKGQPCRRYTAFGILFEETKGWYQVDPHVAEYLKGVRAKPDVSDHPVMLFDICSPEEAARIARQENEAAIMQGRAAPHSAHSTQEVRARDVTSGTLRGPKPPKEAPDLTTKDLASKEGPSPAYQRLAAREQRARASQPPPPPAPRPKPEKEVPQRSMRAPSPGEKG